RILIAPAAFKGTLSPGAAARAMARGVAHAWPASEVRLLPLSDGGDGFLEAILHGRDHLLASTWAEDALGRRRPVPWATLEGGRLAVVELAQAVGIAGLPAPTPHSAATSGTEGLGAVLTAALATAPQRLVIGLGGSASTDGGAGIARKLGYRLLDRAGRELAPGGAALTELARIVAPAQGRPSGPEILAACDVTAPLLGRSGAAQVFGPQKGADAPTVSRLEAGLERLRQVVARDLLVEAADLPGAGAAGGAGFGLVAFCGARLVPGVELVAELVGLDLELSGARLVVTGEGRVDRQSFAGKVVGEVAGRAHRRGLPCLVVAGSADPEAAIRLRRLGAALRLCGEPGGKPESRLEQVVQAACRELAERDDGLRPGPQ
ncbi:MAG: glycerate kinase, partial [Candidatus Dormibacteria bacterium]